jgi:hypothetical protein
MITQQHNGIMIKYHEAKNVWTAENDEKEIDLKRDSLQDIKKAIDDTLRAKQEGRFKRFPALKCGRGWGKGRYERVMVTSITENGDECWITYEKRTENERAQREKCFLSNLYKDTPESREVIAEINTMLNKVDLIEEQITGKEKKLISLK